MTELDLPPTCDVAFKEWAGICRALGLGRQIVVLRKGGIAEGPGGFSPEHGAFWLFPTRLHEHHQGLKEEATLQLWERQDAIRRTGGRRGKAFFHAPHAANSSHLAEADPPAGRTRGPRLDGVVEIDTLLKVVEIRRIEELSTLDRLEREHAWTEETIRSRFAYRNPGLWLMVVRAFVTESPREIPVTEAHEGCRSWVELDPPLETVGVRPVLDDSEFERRRQRVWRALEPEN